MASVRLAEREKDFFFLSQSQGPLSSPVFACALERQRLMPESIAGEKEEEEEVVQQSKRWAVCGLFVLVVTTVCLIMGI